MWWVVLPPAFNPWVVLPPAFKHSGGRQKQANLISVSSRPAWPTEWVRGQSGLHRETPWGEGAGMHLVYFPLQPFASSPWPLTFLVCNLGCYCSHLHKTTFFPAVFSTCSKVSKPLPVPTLVVLESTVPTMCLGRSYTFALKWVNKSSRVGI